MKQTAHGNITETLNAPTESEARIRRVEIMCGLLELAREMKTLELMRRHPTASSDWIRQSTPDVEPDLNPSDYETRA